MFQILVVLVFLFLNAYATAKNVNYTYDDAGRLIQVEYPNDISITYTYDAAGNLLERSIVDSWDAYTAYDNNPTNGKVDFLEMVAGVTDFVLGTISYSQMVTVVTLYVLGA